MNSKLIRLILCAGCGAALAITLTAAAAEAGPLQGADSPASVSTTNDATTYTQYRNDQWHFSLYAPSIARTSNLLRHDTDFIL